MNHSKNKKNKGITPLQDDRNLVTGFTLLEMVIVVAILGILAGITVVAYKSFLDAQRLNAGVEGTISMIQKARELTLASKDESGVTMGKQYGVRFNDKNASSYPNSVQLYEMSPQPPPQSFLVEAEPKFNMPGGVQLFSVIMTPAGNLKDVYFKQLSGDVLNSAGNTITSDAIIVIKSTSSTKQKTIKVGPAGIISIQ